MLIHRQRIPVDDLMPLTGGSVQFTISPFYLSPSSTSALVKQVNKSIDGTADDEEEGVPTEEAIRAGLELLKVKTILASSTLIYTLLSVCSEVFM